MAWSFKVFYSANKISDGIQRFGRLLRNLSNSYEKERVGLPRAKNNNPGKVESPATQLHCNSHFCKEGGDGDGDGDGE